jgi:uncharacterized iron-regulated protein
MHTLRLGAFSVLFAGGCASSAFGPNVGYTLSDVPPVEPGPAATRKAPREPPADVVARSRLPFHGRHVADDRRLSDAELLDELARADAICVGEHHDNPHHHYARLAMIQGLTLRAARSGRALGLGLEMFQRPFQRALDKYASSKIDERALLEQTEYRERWGFPFAYYRPILELARGSGMRLLALNAPTELTRKVARSGLAELDARERAKLPALDLSDPEHRRAFDAAMSGHPKAGSSLDDYYAAQVIWDETMAEAASAWLEQRAPARQLVIAAGQAHCRHEAIPARMERRLPHLRVANVMPVAPGDGAEPTEGYDYELVFER